MPEAKSYTGDCHCGRLRYQITSDVTEALACNCSICSRRGALWSFVKPPQFKLIQGEDALADYQFGKRRIHHLFCRSCGIGAFARGRGPDGAESLAINVRCLDGIDVDSLKLVPFDGKSL